MLFMHFFNSEVLFVLKFLDPLDLFLSFQVLQQVFNVFSIFVIPNFDEVGEIPSFLQNVGRIFDFGRLLVF